MTDVSIARRLSRLNTSYLQARALQTACEVGLFDWLSGHPADAQEICDHFEFKNGIGTHFLDALAGLELLDRQGDVYRNKPELEPFLTSGSESYLGGSFNRHAELHYRLWADLAGALRRGASPSAPISGEGMAFEIFDPVRSREGFVNMDAFNGFVADELAVTIDWSQYETVVDIGGSRGNVAGRLVTAHPHLTGKVFDMKAMVALFDEHQKNLGTDGKVIFYGGDFRSDPLPTGDVYILGHVLPYWREEIRVHLIKRVYDVMGDRGTLLIYDAMLEPGSTEPHGHLLSLLSSVSRVGGEEYTTDDCRSWVEHAGFTVDRIEALPRTIAGERVLIATKGR
jgi:O-methyltransferase domain/Dimerisation domain